MDLIFFDLDGTLLNDASEISVFTKDTLSLLRDKNIAYTVATGRTMLSAQPIMDGHVFELPQIYSNGVTVWNPKTQELALENLLSTAEISIVVDTAVAHGITPFVHSIDLSYQHSIFHTETHHNVEQDLVYRYFSKSKARLLPFAELAINSRVTNISMIGDNDVIHEMWLELNEHANLVAYSGPAMEGKKFSWMDIHHCQASKGSAVIDLKKRLGASNVICFGDSNNDLSMFRLADESYAPKNAKDEIKQCVNEVIGHNHEDGVAHFLRERFSL
jgi:Cof subfamily protein (haloacid dehalogenase superfamily)